MKEPVLTGEALAIGYPAKPQPKVILKNLHLELRAGELVALLGPNGVGKSTLLRTLAGLQAPLQGKVLLKGEPIQEYSPLERARELSLVLTEPVQAGNLRVRELVSLGRFPHTRWAGKLGAQDVAKVEEAIAACRIEYLADSRVFEISDGQRQKAMIARALAQDGLVMLLDEPTAHLDLPNKGEIMHLLHGLAHEFGKAILVSTHDLQLALQMADRLMLADCVEALETGTPEDLMLAGRVAHLFDHPQFQLDTFTGQYRLRREEGKPIAISGPATAKHWLTVALEKQGYLVQSEAEAQVLIEEGEGGYSFHYAGAILPSIAALLATLKAGA